MKMKWMMAVVLALAGIAAGWSRLSPVRVVYDGVTLDGGSTRNDTVVASSRPSDRSRLRFDQIVWAFSGTSEADEIDSMFSVVVKAIVNGVAHQVGDSLEIRPVPPGNGVTRGEIRLMHVIADSHLVVTRNPMSSAVTGVSLVWYGKAGK